MQNIYESVQSNKNQSIVIISVFVVFVAISSWIMGEALGYGPGFVGFGLIFSGMMSFASYWYSDTIILTMSGARVATREEFFNYYTAVENLSMVARIPVPKLYVIDDTAMNAFATGRDPEHAVVCATTGILQRLNRSEIEAVVAHELSHIQNYDIRLMSIVTILVGMLTLLSDWFIRTSFWGRSNNDENKNGQLQAIMAVAGIILALLSPIIAQMIQLAISRNREFLADANAVRLTRQPGSLISALQKISQDVEPLEAANKATAHLYFSNPLKNLHSGVGWFSSLFSTHPPIEERIKALEGMS